MNAIFLKNPFKKFIWKVNLVGNQFLHLNQKHSFIQSVIQSPGQALKYKGVGGKALKQFGSSQAWLYIRIFLESIKI